MKSPAVKEAIRPLRLLEKMAADEFKEEQQRRKIADDVGDLERRAAEQQALKGLRAGTVNRESIENTLSRFAQDEQPPVRRRFITNDPTVEKLVELLKENPAGILLHRDELRAWLASFEREGRESDRSFYLEAWACDDSLTDDRIGRGTIDCDACCVSVLGGLTPGPFLSYLRTAAFSGRGDDGLLQRFQVLVWPDLNGEWQDVDRWPDTSARRVAVEAFGRLANLDAIAIGAETDRFDESVPFLRFDPAAQDEFLEWRSALEHEMRSGKHHEAWECVTNVPMK
jgi:putative DNA primase/helicase